MGKFTIDGNDCLPPVSGGYLVIFLDDEEIASVSVPSPNYADKYSDSVVENDDEVEDDEGNTYSISVYSSNVGVDWTVDVSTDQPGDLRDRIHVEYVSNEY
ncbi:TPA: hypothetical protein LVL09_004852 [Klebsiella oxytoca]|nr:hypothetical protein [Klebsiella oxytoca]